MEITKAIAKRTRDLLIQKKMTQYRLEKNMTIHHSTMTSILNAKYKSADIKTIFLICRGLNISISEFFADPMFEKADIDI